LAKIRQTSSFTTKYLVYQKLLLLPCSIAPCSFFTDTFRSFVSKLTLTVFISLYFHTFWPKWLNFFRSFQNHLYLWLKKNRLRPRQPCCQPVFASRRPYRRTAFATPGIYSSKHRKLSPTSPAPPPRSHTSFSIGRSVTKQITMSSKMQSEEVAKNGRRMNVLRSWNANKSKNRQQLVRNRPNFKPRIDNWTSETPHPCPQCLWLVLERLVAAAKVQHHFPAVVWKWLVLLNICNFTAFAFWVYRNDILFYTVRSEMHLKQWFLTWSTWNF